MKTIKFKNDYKYHGDSRYEKVYEQMQLLGIQDVTTSRQNDNGTVVWRLPIKNNWPRNKSSYIEVASFSTGYVRNQNSGYSNYQLNKRCMGEPEYFKSYKWVDGEQVWDGKYRKFETRKCVLIPNEIDRLEYLLKYVVKNYFIKHANHVPNGEFYPKFMYDSARGNADFHEKRADELANVAPEMPNEVTVIIDGQKYKVI